MLRVAMLCLVSSFGPPGAPEQGCGDAGRAHYEPRSFLGYACEDDCQRHKAGFRWAAERAITDARSCEPLGRLEAQGCRAYLDEPYDARAAGERWAIENEIADPCLCQGAGERFRSGCMDAAAMPSVWSQ